MVSLVDRPAFSEAMGSEDKTGLRWAAVPHRHSARCTNGASGAPKGFLAVQVPRPERPFKKKDRG